MDEVGILAKSRLLKGLRSEEIRELLELPFVRRIACKKGKILSACREASLLLQHGACGVILDGVLVNSFPDEDGNSVIIWQKSAGDCFVASLNSPSPTFAITAGKDCSLILVDFEGILAFEAQDTVHDKTFGVLRGNLAKILAQEYLFLCTRLRICCQRKIRDKLNVYLEMVEVDANGVCNVPFSKTALSQYLCVDRTALCREIGRMKDEQLLAEEHNSYKVLNR